MLLCRMAASLSLSFILSGMLLAFDENPFKRLDHIAVGEYRKLDTHRLKFDAQFEGAPLAITIELDSDTAELSFRYRGKVARVKSSNQSLPPAIDLNSVEIFRGAYQDLLIIHFRAGESFPTCKNTINGRSQSSYSLATDLKTEYVLKRLEFSDNCEVTETSSRQLLNWR